MAYCTRCGVDNPANAKFCMNCAAPLEVGPGPMPAQVSTPSPPPYAYPPRQRQGDCFGQQQPGQDQCLGQSRIPGLVVLAILIILVGIFSLVNWIVQTSYPTIAGTVTSGVFLILGGFVIIVLWLVLRRPRPRM